MLFSNSLFQNLHVSPNIACPSPVNAKNKKKMQITTSVSTAVYFHWTGWYLPSVQTLFVAAVCHFESFVNSSFSSAPALERFSVVPEDAEANWEWYKWKEWLTSIKCQQSNIKHECTFKYSPFASGFLLDFCGLWHAAQTALHSLSSLKNHLFVHLNSAVGTHAKFID